MLREILCDEFKTGGKDGTPRGVIRFHDGLNVVLGHDLATNSIGKSSFLLVIDFAFGGEDYAADAKIKAHIGDHLIKFRFDFDGKPYYFSRSTADADKKSVNVCDENYVPTETITLENFKAKLFTLYKITLSDLSFRDIVGRYFRIYGRENSDERAPLAVYRGEPEKDSILAILELYNLFAKISALHTELSLKEKKQKGYSKLGEWDTVRLITSKKAYNENLARLEKLYCELEMLTSRGRDDLLALAPDQADKAAELKARLDALTRQKKRLWVQYYAVKNASDIHRPATERDFHELTKYFPNSDLKKLSEIETFHSRLQSILKDEFADSMSAILALVNETAREIDIVEAAIKEIDLPQRVSEKTLKSYAEVSKTIGELEKQNDLYTKKGELDADVRATSKRYEGLFLEQIATLQNLINEKMAELNAFIYGDSFEPPIIEIPKPNKYIFETLDDGGTGVSYKNLVLLDLTALMLTELPAVVHDTLIFKNIATPPMGKIIELYAKCEKQVFIAFDNTINYPTEAQAVVKAATVIELSPDGGELFGYYWGKKRI